MNSFSAESVTNSGPRPDARQDQRMLLEVSGLLQDLLNDLVYDPFNNECFAGFCKRLGKILGVGGCWMFQLGRNRDTPVWLNTAESPVKNTAHLWLESNAARDRVISIESDKRSFQVIPLRTTAGLAGGLIVEADPACPGGDLVAAYLGPRLAGIFANLGRARQVRKKEQYEERAAISRELHDSLAQSLTYLKIQVARLRSSVQNAGESGIEEQQLMPAITELQTTLGTAYGQLRELMTTFRLTMHGKTFNEAIEESVMEFSQKSSVLIDLDNRMPSDCLSVDEEMQVLNIVREALSNIVRHSHAKRARVQLIEEPDGMITLKVTDDGVGLDKGSARLRHHGLLIMQERTDNLNGSFYVENSSAGGTLVRSRFKPRGPLTATMG